ncbi:MAG: InlB B-repeat-containing protein, partial [Defluviitaleaceae bacterium]|nr:InlB B-repeat-containing protein [Defluviitaleaceae bacterium]
MKNKIFTRFAFALIFAMLTAAFSLTANASSLPAPVVRDARLVTANFIELHWEGQHYINNAGASKENTTATHRANFEVRLNNTVLTQTDPWYWNITNLSLHGVRVNQNITTLRLSSSLSATQRTAIENGSSTLTVRVVGDVTQSERLGAAATSTPTGAIPAAQIGTPGARKDNARVYTVRNVPYYTTTVVSRDGVPVRGSEHVHPNTVALGASQVDVILSAAPQALLDRLASTSSFVIFGPGEHSYNIPEHRSMFLRDAWNRAEGYGGQTSATSAAGVTRWHVLSVAQRNTHAGSATHPNRYPDAYRTGYANESILAHEFGHGIMNAMGGTGGNGAPTTAFPANPGSPTHRRREMEDIYGAVIRMHENPVTSTGRLRWQGATTGQLTYMSSNAHEFIATATSIWFDAMSGGTWQDNGRGPVTRREHLRRYCVQSYNFFSRIFPEAPQHLSPAWSSVTHGNGPTYPQAPPVPSGRWGAPVKIKTTLATNSAGAGLKVYTPFNATANSNINQAVELWWDINTELMEWFLDPVDETEQFFRIRKRVINTVAGSHFGHTANVQREDLVLMPQNSATASGTRIVLGASLANSNSNANAQQWSFLPQQNGNFVIVNRANPQTAITLRNNALASGTQIQLGATATTSAVWAVSGNTFTSRAVTYNLNGGTGTVPTESQKIGGANFSAASIANITAPNARTFKEWNTAQDGSGTAYAPGANVTMPWNALTLFAIWQGSGVTVTVEGTAAAQTSVSPSGAQIAGTLMTVTLTAPANQRIAGTGTTISSTITFGLDFLNFNLTIAADRRTATGTFIMRENNATITVNATFENIVTPIFSILLDPATDRNFPAATVGYGEISPHSVTVRNTGNQPTGALRVALSGTNASNFIIGHATMPWMHDMPLPNINVGNGDSFMVQPREGLPAGTYNATVTVSSSTTLNRGRGAVISTSGTREWENHEHVRESVMPTSSSPGAGNGWGTWDLQRNGSSAARSAFLQYAWPETVRMNRAEIFWYDDNGGTRIPTATTWAIQSSNDGTSWTNVTLTGATNYNNGRALNRFNIFEFEEVEARFLRVYIWGITANAAGTGILRFQVFRDTKPQTIAPQSFNVSFTVNAPQNFTVTFDPNGGTRASGGQLSQTDAQNAAGTAPVLTRAGFVFGGWNRELTNITANTTITANWLRIG